MNGRIDEIGSLWIVRGHREKAQECPFDSHLRACGDWCPCFREEFNAEGETISVFLGCANGHAGQISTDIDIDDRPPDDEENKT